MTRSARGRRRGDNHEISTTTRDVCVRLLFSLCAERNVSWSSFLKASLGRKTAAAAANVFYAIVHCPSSSSVHTTTATLPEILRVLQKTPIYTANNYILCVNFFFFYSMLSNAHDNNIIVVACVGFFISARGPLSERDALPTFVFFIGAPADSDG